MTLTSYSVYKIMMINPLRFKTNEINELSPEMLEGLRPRHMMRQIAATHRVDRSPRLLCCCDKAACAYFVAAIFCTNSNQFEFVRQIAATKLYRSDNDFHMSHEAICCGNLSRRYVAVICRIVCLGL